MQENKIGITWYGTASVRLSAGNTSLLTDPFFPFPDSPVKVDAHAFDPCSHILISHGHYDHIGSIGSIVQPETTIYCTKTPYHTLAGRGVRTENLHLIEAGSVFRAGAFHVTAYKGKHIHISAGYSLNVMCGRHAALGRKGMFGKLMKLASCPEKHETLCYLVETYGKRILILGSLALDENTEYPTDVDLAFFPYQGSFRICRIAEEIYGRLRPRAVLLTHFDDTFPPFSAEIDTSEFEAYMKHRAPVYKLRHGETLYLSQYTT